MERYQFQACSRSVPGIRPVNEDACEIRRISHPSGMILLLAVADGLGGHPAGEVASSLAVRTLGDIVGDQLTRLPEPDRRSLEALMELAFRETNRRVISISRQDEGCQGMGTTLVAALITGADSCVIGNIGDSRAYRIGETMERLTRDHSQVQELVDQGILSPAEAERHPQRNIVTRIIGREGDLADISSCPLGNNRILLCSDGLLDGLTEQEIFAVAAKGRIPVVCTELIEAARERSRDNITVIIAGLSGT